MQAIKYHSMALMKDFKYFDLYEDGYHQFLTAYSSYIREFKKIDIEEIMMKLCCRTRTYHRPYLYECTALILAFKNNMSFIMANFDKFYDLYINSFDDKISINIEYREIIPKEEEYAITLSYYSLPNDWHMHPDFYYIYDAKNEFNNETHRSINTNKISAEVIEMELLNYIGNFILLKEILTKQKYFEEHESKTFSVIINNHEHHFFMPDGYEETKTLYIMHYDTTGKFIEKYMRINNLDDQTKLYLKRMMFNMSI
jgi:hypothetical protein